mgnify:CR=1 FL=1
MRLDAGDFLASRMVAGTIAMGPSGHSHSTAPVSQTAPVTGAQVNAFNQTSVMCRIYQDRSGVQHVLYSAILFRSMTREDASTHLQAWQGCLADANDFLRDPVA